uniref:NADH-ubiquinone oxidoreductase chain 5 n=2 Tax=Lumbriculus variegatus TaxID=61662 RepID=A0A7D7AD42_9ANNE|nr:NADH dehydrogenase subunit 5 [Lumbriculus variegatus]
MTTSKLLWLLLLCLMVPTLNCLYYNSTTLMELNLLVNNTPMNMTLLYDPKGSLFSLVVLLISANVMQFSSEYMKDDKFKDRFSYMVILFVMSMNFLIYIPHFIMLLLGWDGLGIVSFILVIYYQNPKSLAAGLITALTNRIGDALLLLSIALTLNQGHWNIINMYNTQFMSLQTGMIIIAAMTKSAQIPFSSWLPAAMAAPTPVSALVHSSTLVTAGVFLSIRFYPMLAQISWFNKFLLIMATLTMMMAGLSAMTECDMKKIIALSTLSQLGMMMTSLGLGLPQLAYFHMLMHALFKALLFICAGLMIHSHQHNQDLRWMGNMSKNMPVTLTCITIANMALCGLPYLTGFYSKDLILETMCMNITNSFTYSLIMFSIGFTSFYSFRFMMAVLWSPKNAVSYNCMEEPTQITKPMMTMTMASVVMGSLTSWMYPQSSMLVSISALEKFCPLLMISLGMLSSYIIGCQKFAMLHQKLHFMSCLMWFMTPLSSQFMLKQPLMLAKNSLSVIDQSWLEL